MLHAFFVFISFCMMAVMELLFLYVVASGEMGGLVMMMFSTPLFLLVYQRQKEIFHILGKPFPPVIHLMSRKEEQ